MVLSSIFGVLSLTLLVLLFIPAHKHIIQKQVALIGSGFALILSCWLLFTFSTNTFYFQNFVLYNIGFEALNFYFCVGLDGLSILFFCLSSFLVFLCILFLWDNASTTKFYLINLLLIQFCLLFVFSALDLLLFYIFFEALLIPMFFLVGVWGSRERKIRAVYLLFFYTLIGSLFFLLGLLYIYAIAGTLQFEYLLHFNFTEEEEFWLWLSFFLSFASKIPLFPFHIWLPEAHVEAPTVGSVLLAGILLKLGVYGFLRFSLSLFPTASLYFSPLLYVLALVGIIYSSLTAIRQTDIKRIIAYSSIAHMNLVTLGLFSSSVIGIEGAILQSITHGFVSGGLFFLIGILYNRYHTRYVLYYSGLVHFMPIYSAVFLVFTLSNIALPGTGSFVGEFMLLLSLYQNSFLSCAVATLSVILCGSYSLWLYNRMFFGNLNIISTHIYKDLSLLEIVVLSPMFLFIFIIGVYPNFFITKLHYSVLALVLKAAC
jgi:NADH-quinone oxidoreductase subunit M